MKSPLRYSILFLAGVSGLLGSCSKSVSQIVSLIRIPVTQESFCTKDTFSNFIRIDKLIKLETIPESLITLPVHFDFADSLIFVCEQSSRKFNLLVFTESGKFLRRLNKPGKGPGEMTRLESYGIDSVNNQVILLDDSDKVLIKDYNGNLISEFKSPEMANGVIRLDEKRLAFASQGEHLVYITDRTGKEIRRIKNPGLIAYNPVFFPLIRIGNDILLKRELNDTLLSLNNDTLKPRILVDYGQHALTSQQYIEAATQPGKTSISNEVMWDTSIHGFSNGIMTFQFGFNRKNMFGYSDLTNRKTIVFEWKKVITDPVLHKGFFPMRSIREDHFTGVFIPGYMDIDSLPDILKKVGPINSNDNPILVLYKFVFPL